MKSVFLLPILISLSIYSSLAQDTGDKSNLADWSNGQTWLYGILATIGTSSTGFIMSLLFIPIMKWKWMTQSRLSAIINIMMAFSMGSAIGDVFYQIMPLIYGPPAPGTGSLKMPDPNKISTVLICSFIFYCVLDRIFSAFEGKEGAHSHAMVVLPNKINEEDPEKKEDGAVDIERVHVNADNQQSQDNKDPPESDKKKETCFQAYCGIKGRKRLGVMILISDFFHNIMDGVALGTAFASQQKKLAISTLLAVFAHEIPQEISDMGILIHSNFTAKQGVFCNGMINCSAIIGVVIGLGIGTLDDIANAYLMSFVAGNFIYISAVQIMPVLLEEKRNKVSLFALIFFGISAAIQYALTLI